MKKKRPKLYQEFERGTIEKTALDEPENRRWTIGSEFKVEKPSGAYYQFIYGSLAFEKHILADLQNLLKAEGRVVSLYSLMSMKDGDLIGVMQPKRGRPITRNVDKLYISLQKALKAKEITFL